MERKRLTTGVLTFLLIIIFSIQPIFGYIGTGPSNPKKIETWHQDNYPKLSDKEIVPGGSTIGKASCGYWAFLAAAIKDDRDNKELTPEKFFEKVYQVRPNNTEWGHLNFERVNELGVNLELPTLSELGDENIRNEYSYVYSFYPWTSYQQQIDSLKELLKKGYYVIVCFEAERGGHYIFLDYIDLQKNDIRIFDSAYKGTWLSDYYTKDERAINYFVILKGKNLKQKYSIYEDNEAKKHNALVDFSRLTDLDKKENKKEVR